MRRVHDAPCTLQMEWAPYKCSNADTLRSHKLMSVEHDIIHSGYSTGFDEHQYFEYPDYGYDPLMVSSTPQKAVMSAQSMPMKQEFEEQILDRISSPLYDDLYGSTTSLSLHPQQQVQYHYQQPQHYQYHQHSQNRYYTHHQTAYPAHLTPCYNSWGLNIPSPTYSTTDTSQLSFTEESWVSTPRATSPVSVLKSAQPTPIKKNKTELTPQELQVKYAEMGPGAHPYISDESKQGSLNIWVPLSVLTPERKALILHKAKAKNLNTNVILNHLQLFPCDDWDTGCPEELKDMELPVVHIAVGGSALKKTGARHIKRPLNSFMIYRKAQTQRACRNAALAGVKINHQTISSTVGLLWQTEEPYVHAYFNDAACVEKYLHQEKHPDYKFQPRKKPKHCPQLVLGATSTPLKDTRHTSAS